MYPWVLLLHSWLRWLVVLAALAVPLAALRGREHGPLDRKLSLLFVSSMDLQLLLGLLLYFWLSPITAAIRHGEAPGWMKDAGMRFWGMEHLALMLLAVVAAHVGAVKAKRAGTPRQARKWSVASALVALALVAAAIPWPALAHYGRPLFRGLP